MAALPASPLARATSRMPGGTMWTGDRGLEHRLLRRLRSVGWEKGAKPLGERATEVLAEGTKLVKKPPVRPDRTHRRQRRPG